MISDEELIRLWAERGVVDLRSAWEAMPDGPPSQLLAAWARQKKKREKELRET